MGGRLEHNTWWLTPDWNRWWYIIIDKVRQCHRFVLVSAVVAKRTFILDHSKAFGMQRKSQLCFKRSLSEDGLNWRYNIHFTRCWSRSCKSHNFMAIVEVKDTHTSFLMYGYNYYQANLIIRRCAKSAINILEQKSKKCEVKQYVL